MAIRLRLLDPNALGEDYIPKKILFREAEYKQLMADFKLFRQGFPPSRIVVWGPPGCGKTITVKRAFADAGIKHYYILCKGTEYLTLMELSKAVLGKERFGTGLLPWSEIEPKLSGCYVILDEADKFMSRGGDELLYCLSRASNVGLVLVSNKMNLMSLVKDARVQSSLLPASIWFRAYDYNEVKTILLTRAEEAIADCGTVLSDGVLNLIVAKAMAREGDVRFAITLLRESVKLALLEDAARISEDHVRAAEDLISQREVERAINELTSTQKLLLLCVTRGDTPSAIYEMYNKLSAKFGRAPVTNRRLRMIMAELELFGLVSVRRHSSNKFKVSLASWLDVGKTRDILEHIFFCP